MTKIPYEQAREIVDYADDVCEYWSKKLNSFEKGEYGLTPTHVKAMPEFQQAKREFDKAFKHLQTMNKWFMKNYKKEYMKERANRKEYMEKRAKRERTYHGI